MKIIKNKLVKLGIILLLLGILITEMTLATSTIPQVPPACGCPGNPDCCNEYSGGCWRYGHCDDPFTCRHTTCKPEFTPATAALALGGVAAIGYFFRKRLKK